ncbi:hypothetical protein Bca4012_094864 [Brassica carinata]
MDNDMEHYLQPSLIFHTVLLSSSLSATTSIKSVSLSLPLMSRPSRLHKWIFQNLLLSSQYRISIGQIEPRRVSSSIILFELQRCIQTFSKTDKWMIDYLKLQVYMISLAQLEVQAIDSYVTPNFEDVFPRLTDFVDNLRISSFRLSCLNK